jgi:hypothetical protein
MGCCATVQSGDPKSSAKARSKRIKLVLSLHRAFTDAHKYSNPDKPFDKKEKKSGYTDSLQPQFYPLAVHTTSRFCLRTKRAVFGLTA